MEVSSPAFEHHKEIPQRYTCQGEDVSPPLIFKDIPKGSKSLAIIMEDPDAPSGTFYHWVAWDLSATSNSLTEGAQLQHTGKNGFNKVGYGGPCPPPGKPHRYFFKVFALDTKLSLPNGSSKADLEKAMEGHVIGKAELVGLYQRH